MGGGRICVGLEQDVVALDDRAARLLEIDEIVELEAERLHQRGTVDAEDARARGVHADATVGLERRCRGDGEGEVHSLAQRAAEHDRGALHARAQLLERCAVVGEDDRIEEGREIVAGEPGRSPRHAMVNDVASSSTAGRPPSVNTCPRSRSMRNDAAIIDVEEDVAHLDPRRVRVCFWERRHRRRLLSVAVGRLRARPADESDDDECREAGECAVSFRRSFAYHELESAHDAYPFGGRQMGLGEASQ